MSQVALSLCMRVSRLTSSPIMSCPAIFQQRSFVCPALSVNQSNLHPFNPLEYYKVPLVNFSTSGSQCWKCGQPSAAEHKFCPSCHTIQPLKDELNYFEVLGLKAEFNLNSAQLSTAFKDLQRLFHPDKFSTASEREQELSAEHSSSINKAYQTLLQPLPRAEHLLLLSGQMLHEADTDLDKNFLTTVLELNEDLAEAETDVALAEVKQHVLLTHDLLIRDLTAAFTKGDTAVARSLVAQAKYYRSLLDKFRDEERERGILD